MNSNVGILEPMKHHAMEEGEAREEKSEVKSTGLLTFFNMVGGVAGLLSMLTVALMGGELRRQVVVDTRRIDLIEASGSSQAQIAIRTLVSEVDSRKEADQITSRRVDDVRIDFNQRITNITGLLEKLVDQQTQLITLIKVQQQQNNSK